MLMGYSKGSALWPAPSSLCCRVPCAEVGLLAVVARAGPQVSGVGVALIADHLLVEAAVRVGVFVGDLGGIDEAIGVLLRLCGSRARAASLVRQWILIRILTRIGVQLLRGTSHSCGKVTE